MCGFKSQLGHLLARTLGQSLNPSMPPFFHLYNGASDNIYLAGLIKLCNAGFLIGYHAYNLMGILINRIQSFQMGASLSLYF